jgi:hypothetical protein
MSRPQKAQSRRRVGGSPGSGSPGSCPLELLPVVRREPRVRALVAWRGSAAGALAQRGRGLWRLRAARSRTPPDLEPVPRECLPLQRLGALGDVELHRFAPLSSAACSLAPSPDLWVVVERGVPLVIRGAKLSASIGTDRSRCQATEAVCFGQGGVSTPCLGTTKGPAPRMSPHVEGRTALAALPSFGRATAVRQMTLLWPPSGRIANDSGRAVALEMPAGIRAVLRLLRFPAIIRPCRRRSASTPPCHRLSSRCLRNLRPSG